MFNCMFDVNYPITTNPCHSRALRPHCMYCSHIIRCMHIIVYSSCQIKVPDVFYTSKPAYLYILLGIFFAALIVLSCVS